MDIATGGIIVAIAIAMVWLARSRDGEPIKPFRKYWVVGHLYAVAVMALGVLGIATMLGAGG